MLLMTAMIVVLALGVGTMLVASNGAANLVGEPTIGREPNPS